MQYVPPRGSLDPNADYIGGDPASGIRGSYVPPGAVENPMREVCNAITLSGQTQDAGDLTQLWKAMLRAANGALAGVTASEGNKAATNGAPPNVTRDVSWDIPNLATNGSVTAPDLFGYYKVADAHHRKVDWATLLGLIASTIVNPVDIQIAGLGTQVGQQITQFISCPGNSTPEAYGWEPGQTTSAAVLAAGIYQVPGYGIPFQVQTNSAVVQVNLGFGVAGGKWTNWPGLAGTWQMTGWQEMPGWSNLGYPFLVIWKRIA